MKRIVALLLVALLLTGCTGQTPAPSVATDPAETTLPVETTAPQQTTAPVDPGTYIIDSAIELETAGAVRSFDTGLNDCTGIYTMGEELLLISGYDFTTLTVLTGENLSVAVQKTMDSQLTMSGASVQVNENGIAYHDLEKREIVFLNTALQETRRLQLPDGAMGNAVIAPDHSAVYVCTADGVYAMDVAAGITRTLREQTASYQSVSDIHFDGTVLSWYSEISQEDYGETTYLSAQTGETLYSDREVSQLFTARNRYVACVQDGSVDVWLTADQGQQPQTLQLPQGCSVLQDFNGDRLVFMSGDTSGQTLKCVNIHTGAVEGAISLTQDRWVSHIAQDGAYIWMLVYDSTVGRDHIYGWDLAKSGTSDTTNYLQPWYTAEHPDIAGLNQCKLQAQQIGQRYGVDILIGEDVLDYVPWDYTMVTEYQVAAYQRDLEKLDTMLASFPDGFMEAIASGTSNGRMTICLVRSLLGDPMQGSLESANGIQYWLDESAYMALTMGGGIEQIFYHELSHVMENRIISTTYAFDFWGDLNPEGFEYDYDYIANASRQDYDYLGETEGQERAFIDMYSMSFPKEDRARIFEYAMMPYNEYFFESEIMQNKLRTVSLGIREAFELESETPYIWEQYLKEPIIIE